MGMSCWGSTREYLQADRGERQLSKILEELAEIKRQLAELKRDIEELNFLIIGISNAM